MLKFKEGITKEVVIASLQGGLTRHMGIVITELGDDYIKAKMPVTENHKQPFGLLHGGAHAVLAETLGSIGSFMMVDSSKYNVVGVEVNAQHLRSVQDGHVYAHARPVHTGRKIHHWQVDITDDKERLVCIARLTTMVIDKVNG